MGFAGSQFEAENLREEYDLVFVFSKKIRKQSCIFKIKYDFSKIQKKHKYKNYKKIQKYKIKTIRTNTKNTAKKYKNT